MRASAAFGIIVDLSGTLLPGATWGNEAAEVKLGLADSLSFTNTQRGASGEPGRLFLCDVNR